MSATDSRLTRNRLFQAIILVVIVMAALAVWLTRAGDRPALAIAHLPIAQIEIQLNNELVAIHGEDVCRNSESSALDASGYSFELASEHENGVPSERAIAHLEEHSHAFEEVDDIHIQGASVTFVAYSEREGDTVTSVRGIPLLGSVGVMLALSGGEAGEPRWEFVERIAYYRCE